MSEPNDRAFEDYLEGKSAVSARYRELSTDDVPPEIDAAVMARARAAIASRASNSSRLPKMSAWRRWRAPLAVAASAVLVVSILLNAGPEQ
jgi:negative regulator of sigma E activity